MAGGGRRRRRCAGDHGGPARGTFTAQSGARRSGRGSGGGRALTAEQVCLCPCDASSTKRDIARSTIRLHSEDAASKLAWRCGTPSGHVHAFLLHVLPPACATCFTPRLSTGTALHIIRRLPVTPTRGRSRGGGGLLPDGYAASEPRPARRGDGTPGAPNGSWTPRSMRTRSGSGMLEGAN